MSVRTGIGIISFAHGHARMYCDRMRSFDDVRLVACWDDDEARGRAAAAECGMAFSPHIEDLLHHRDIQAVVITCETFCHAEMAIAAARAGKHILCQKPMALSLDDCDRMADAARKAGVTFMMAYQMRHDPSNIKIKELIGNGTLGKIGLLRRRHCLNMFFNESFVNGPTRWHFDPVKNMGMWMDDACHATDFIHWIMGRPVSVVAEIGNTLTSVAQDDTGVAIYRFASGAMAALTNSSATLAGENTTEVYGDQGVLIQNYDDLVSTSIAPPGAVALKLFTRTQPQWEDLGIPIPASHGERIANVPRAFIDCLRHETEPPVSAADGRVSVEMILGAYQSAKEGQRISFPLTS